MWVVVCIHPLITTKIRAVDTCPSEPIMGTACVQFSERTHALKHTETTNNVVCFVGNYLRIIRIDLRSVFEFVVHV